MVAKLGEMELRSPAAPHRTSRQIVGEALLDSGQKDKALPILQRALGARSRLGPGQGRARRRELRPRVLDRRGRPADRRGRAVRRGDRGAHAGARGADPADRGARGRAARGAAQADPRQGHRRAERELPVRDPARRAPTAGTSSRPTTAGAPSARPITSRRSRRCARSASSGCSGSRTATAARSSSTPRCARPRPTAWSPMRSVVAAFTLVRQVQGDTGEWAQLLDIADALLDRPSGLAGEDKLYIAIQAGEIAFDKTNDIDRARRFFAVAARIEPQQPAVQDFAAAVGLPPPVDVDIDAAATAAGSMPMAAHAEPHAAAQLDHAAGHAAGHAAAPVAHAVAAVAPPIAPAPVAPAPAPVAPVVEERRGRHTQPPPAAAGVPLDLDAAMMAARAAEAAPASGVAAWKDVVAAPPAGPRGPPRARARAAHRPVVGPARRRAQGRGGQGRATPGPTRRGAARARRGLRQAQQRQPGDRRAVVGAARTTRRGSRSTTGSCALYEAKKRWPDLVKVLLEKAERVDARRTRSRSPAGRQPLPRAVLEPGRGDQGVRARARARPEQQAGGRSPARGLREAPRLGEADQAQGGRGRARARRRARRQGDRGRADGRDQGQEARDLHVLVGEGPAGTSRPTRRRWPSSTSSTSATRSGTSSPTSAAGRPTPRPTTSSAPTRCSASACSTPRRSRTAPRRSRPGSACSRIDENNRRAQDALKKLYVTEARWADLEEFYRSRGKLDEYIRVLEREVEAGSEHAPARARDEDRGALPRRAAEGRPRDARVREGAARSTRTTSRPPRP